VEQEPTVRRVTAVDRTGTPAGVDGGRRPEPNRPRVDRSGGDLVTPDRDRGHAAAPGVDRGRVAAARFHVDGHFDFVPAVLVALVRAPVVGTVAAPAGPDDQFAVQREGDPLRRVPALREREELPVGYFAVVRSIGVRGGRVERRVHGEREPVAEAAERAAVRAGVPPRPVDPVGGPADVPAVVVRVGPVAGVRVEVQVVFHGPRRPLGDAVDRPRDGAAAVERAVDDHEAHPFGAVVEEGDRRGRPLEVPGADGPVVRSLPGVGRAVVSLVSGGDAEVVQLFDRIVAGQRDDGGARPVLHDRVRRLVLSRDGRCLAPGRPSRRGR